MNINKQFNPFFFLMLYHKYVELWNVLYSGQLRKKVIKYSHGSFI
jgi:hypothetical protein